MATTDATHQCPYCELRFAFRTELADHLRADHPRAVDDDTPGRAPGAAARAPAHALVVYESMFGNTRTIAEAVAAGLAEGAAVELVEVGQAPTTLDRELDLLVVGGPTHAFGLSRRATREEAATVAHHALVSPGRGLREWLDDLDGAVARTRVATFDTRFRHVPGSAARAAARRLRRRGFALAAKPASFHVVSREGPLASGEEDRARRWGRVLVGVVGTFGPVGGGGVGTLASGGGGRRSVPSV